MDHTPGPWEVDATGCIRSTVKKSGYAPSIPLASGWIEGAWCDSDATPESIANAYLCAGAPEMKSVLEEFVREYAGFEDGNGEPCPTLLRAQAVLASLSPPSTKE